MILNLNERIFKIKKVTDFIIIFPNMGYIHNIGYKICPNMGNITIIEGNFNPTI